MLPQQSLAVFTTGHNFSAKCCTVMLFLLTLLLPVSASAQPANQTGSGGDTYASVPLLPHIPMKVKLVRDLSSGTIRVGDYVEFIVAEDVLAPDAKGDLRVVVKKDTHAFGRVIDRHHKFSLFKTGKFNIVLDRLRAVDLQEIPVFITRPNNYPACPSNSERAPRDQDASAPDAARKGLIVGRCVAGRVYSGTFLSNLPSAVLTAASTAALVIAEDPTAKAAAAVTLVQQVSSKDGLGSILNGADAVITKDEFFDAYVKNLVTIKVKNEQPASKVKTKEKSSEEDK